MTAPTTLSPLRNVLQTLSAAALADLEQLWNLSPEELAVALFDVLPGLVDTWGEASAAAAADWYDEVRAAQNIGGQFTAIVEPLGDVGANALAGWAAEPLNQPEPDMGAARSRLEDGFQKRLVNSANLTVTGSAAKDPQARGYQRRTRVGACRFCVMVASKGGVYTKASSTFACHGHCFCEAVPAWGGEALPVRDYKPSDQPSTPEDRARVRKWLNDNIGPETRVPKASIPAVDDVWRDTGIPGEQWMAPKLDLPRLTGSPDPVKDIVNVNPKWLEDRAYQQNCTRATTATELRRRGYNVTAQGTTVNTNDSYDAVLKRWLTPEGNQAGQAGLRGVVTRPKSAVPFGMDQERSFNAIPGVKTARKNVEDAVKEWGDGSRGFIGVTWKGNEKSHIFNIENRGGAVHYIDGQVSSSDVSKYWDRVRPKSGAVKIVRVDDLIPSKEVELWVDAVTAQKVADAQTLAANKAKMLARQEAKQAERTAAIAQAKERARLARQGIFG